MDYENGKTVMIDRGCQINFLQDLNNYYIMRESNGMYLSNVEGGFKWSNNFNDRASFSSIYESKEAIDWTFKNIY